MTPEIELLRKWFQRVWAERDPNAIDEMFPAPGIAHGLGAQTLVGAEDFKQFHAALCNLLDDIKIKIDHSVQNGKWTSVLITITAKSQSHGDVCFTGSCMTEIEDGVIKQAYNHVDFMTLWGQLGLLPQDAMEQGLQGQTIR